jgi:hypothetical protein
MLSADRIGERSAPETLVEPAPDEEAESRDGPMFAGRVPLFLENPPGIGGRNVPLTEHRQHRREILARNPGATDLLREIRKCRGRRDPGGEAVGIG